MNTKKLKQLVLDLAIHGKLVPQDPNDEPASELLARIRAEKAASQDRAAKGKKSAISSENLDEVPFEVPEGWCWCKVTDVLTKITDGTHHSPENLPQGDFMYVTAKNIKSHGVDLSNITYVDKATHEEIYARCNPELGDILYIKDGATTGIACINNIEEPFSLLSSVALLKPCRMIENRYLLRYLQSSYCYSSVRDTMKGVGITRITLKLIGDWFIPLPPLSEQRRIVAEIERWFGVIDQLESNEADLKKSIERTKKKVLDLAIRGKLVKQEKGDEPARELLARIRAEKADVQGRASKGKKTAIPSVELDEVPFEVPEGWEWCRLLDIAEQVGSKENQILAKEVLGEGLVPVVSQSSILIDGYSDETDRKMTDLPVILFGDHTRVVKYIDFEFVVGADGTKLLKPLINSKYLYYWTICAADSIRNRGYARHFALLKEVPFPLPPLEEQRRIVERVEEVMEVLGRIEEVVKS